MDYCSLPKKEIFALYTFSGPFVVGLQNHKRPPMFLAHVHNFVGAITITLLILVLFLITCRPASATAYVRNEIV